MIYHHKSPEFQGYLSSGKHTPTTEEAIDALQDPKKKMPGLGAVDLANALRAKHPSAGDTVRDTKSEIQERAWAELNRRFDVDGRGPQRAGALALLEKGAVGSRWSKRWVVVDWKSSSVAYFATDKKPNDNRSRPSRPGRGFKLGDLTLRTQPSEVSAQAGEKANVSFQLLERSSKHLITFACATPQELAEWVQFLNVVMAQHEIEKNCEALIEAVDKGDTDAVRGYIAKGVNVNWNSGLTPLIWAADGGDVAVAEILIAAGADVDLAKDGHRTPLIWAAVRGHVAVVEMLIAAGADVDRATRARGDLAENDGQWGETPLHAAAGQGCVAVVEMLIAAGADANLTCNLGQTPLHSASNPNLCDAPSPNAAEMGYVAIAEMLIAAGARVNLADKDGFTPLHCAAGKGHLEVVQLLLRHRADKELKNNNGDKPVDIVCTLGYITLTLTAITALLR